MKTLSFSITSYPGPNQKMKNVIFPKIPYEETNFSPCKSAGNIAFIAHPIGPPYRPINIWKFLNGSMNLEVMEASSCLFLESPVKNFRI